MPNKIIRRRIADYNQYSDAEERPKFLRLLKKRVEAKLDDYIQIYPEAMNELNTVVDNLVKASDTKYYNFTSFYKTVIDMPFFKRVDKVVTKDGYHWQAGVFFEFNEGTIERTRVAVLFPNVNDKEEVEGTRMDRSVGIYALGVEWRKSTDAAIKELVKRVDNMDLYSEHCEAEDIFYASEG